MVLKEISTFLSPMANNSLHSNPLRSKNFRHQFLGAFFFLMYPSLAAKMLTVARALCAHTGWGSVISGVGELAERDCTQSLVAVLARHFTKEVSPATLEIPAEVSGMVSVASIEIKI